MAKDLAKIREIDKSAVVERLPTGPAKGEWAVSNTLSIPPHAAWDSPAGKTADEALREFWKWIENATGSITVGTGNPRNRPRYRWSGSGWVKQ